MKKRARKEGHEKKGTKRRARKEGNQKKETRRRKQEEGNKKKETKWERTIKCTAFATKYASVCLLTVSDFFWC